MKKALVLAIVMVLGLGTLAFAGPLSGKWSSEICFGVLSYDGTAFTYGLSGLESALTIDYSVCGWKFESVSEFGLGGWETQSFTAGGVLGAFEFDSTLVFDPASASFTYWDTTGGVSIAGVGIDAEFLLEDTGAGWMFGLSGLAGACELSADIYFNSVATGSTPGIALQTDSYCFCFSSVEFSTSFPFCCVEQVDVSVGFSYEKGFDGVTFSVSAIELPISWLTLDAELTFDDGIGIGKKLTITPGLNLGDVFCFDIYAELVVDGGLIDGLNIYGIGLTCDMGQGVIFESVSALDWPLHHVTVGGVADVAVGGDLAATLCCGEASYWERFSISSSADACCGGSFGFDLDVYFGQDFVILEGETVVYTCVHPWLFDISRIDVGFSAGLGSNFALTGGVSLVDQYYYEDLCYPFGLSEFCIGFEVSF